MNVFQRQLLINGKSLAELPDLDGDTKPIGFYGEIASTQRVSVEEFEKTMRQVRNKLLNSK